MNVLWLLLAWRQSDRLLEQIRRNQLTPAERTAEDKAKNEEAMAAYRTRQIAVVICLAAGLIILIVRYLITSSLV